MAAEDNPALKLIRARVKKEYRKVFDKDYDREEAKRSKVSKGKAGARSKRRKHKASQRSKAAKAHRKVLLIRDIPDE